MNETTKTNGNGSELATRAPDAQVMEQVIAQGNLAQLTAPQRVAYYMRVCESVGLNPYTQPFEYLNLNGKLRLYATKTCTDQLRDMHGVSVEKLVRTRDAEAGIYMVEAHVRNAKGRTDCATGAVPLGNVKGEALANAIMKAETKAKRRATLSICGLGWLDESETDSIEGAQKVKVDPATGEIISTVTETRQSTSTAALVLQDKGMVQTIEEQARVRNESDEIAKAWNETDLPNMPTADALLAWCDLNGWQYLGLHTNAKGRTWTQLQKAAARLSVPLDEIKRAIKASQPPEERDEDAATDGDREQGAFES